MNSLGTGTLASLGNCGRRLVLLLPLLHLLLFLLRLFLLSLQRLLVVLVEVLLRFFLRGREVGPGVRQWSGQRQGECEKQSGTRESFHSFTTKLALSEFYTCPGHST